MQPIDKIPYKSVVVTPVAFCRGSLTFRYIVTSASLLLVL